MNTSLIKKLGWVPKVNLEEGLKVAYQDFLDNTASSL